MDDPTADVDEFRSKNLVSTVCPVCEHTVSHWGKADRLKVLHCPQSLHYNRAQESFESLLIMAETAEEAAPSRESFVFWPSSDKGGKEENSSGHLFISI